MSLSTTTEVAPLHSIITRHAAEGRRQLIPMLLEAQAVNGFLSESVVEAIGEGLQVPPGEIHGVIEFYTMLYARPTGHRRPGCMAPARLRLG